MLGASTDQKNEHCRVANADKNTPSASLSLVSALDGKQPQFPASETPATPSTVAPLAHISTSSVINASALPHHALSSSPQANLMLPKSRPCSDVDKKTRYPSLSVEPIANRDVHEEPVLFEFEAKAVQTSQVSVKASASFCEGSRINDASTQAGLVIPAASHGILHSHRFSSSQGLTLNAAETAGDSESVRRATAVEKKAADLSTLWVHPKGSTQLNSTVLHRIRAILSLYPHVSFNNITRITGISAESLVSLYVQGRYSGNQKRMEEKMDRFVLEFLDGKHDAFLNMRRKRKSESIASVKNVNIGAPSQPVSAATFERTVQTSQSPTDASTVRLVGAPVRLVPPVILEQRKKSPGATAPSMPMLPTTETGIEAATVKPVSTAAHGRSENIPVQAPHMSVSAPVPAKDTMVARRKTEIDREASAISAKWVHPQDATQVNSMILHRLRAILNLYPLFTQTLIAHIAGVSQGSVSQYMRGRFRGNQEIMEEKLGIFVCEVLEGKHDALMQGKSRFLRRRGRARSENLGVYKEPVFIEKVLKKPVQKGDEVDQSMGRHYSLQTQNAVVEKQCHRGNRMEAQLEQMYDHVAKLKMHRLQAVDNGLLGEAKTPGEEPGRKAARVTNELAEMEEAIKQIRILQQENSTGQCDSNFNFHKQYQLQRYVLAQQRYIMTQQMQLLRQQQLLLKQQCLLEQGNRRENVGEKRDTRTAAIGLRVSSTGDEKDSI